MLYQLSYTGITVYFTYLFQKLNILPVKSKQFAIYGDQDINDKVTDDFWKCTKDIMLEHFKNGRNKQALVDGIHNAGQQLKKYFPYQSDDTDELSNEISKGE